MIGALTPIATSNVSHGRPLIAAKRPRTTARRCDFILMKRVAEQKMPRSTRQ